MSNMIAKVVTEYRAPITHTHPWVCEKYVPEEDEYRVLTEHKTEIAAKSAARRAKAELPASKRVDADSTIQVRERRTHGGGWVVMVHFVDGSGYGYGSSDKNKPMSEAEANAAADRDRARIGVVDSMMMASSAYSVIVLRPCEGGRWTAGIGVGSHTKHVKGSYPTDAAAEAAAREAISVAWQDGLGYWRRKAEHAGIVCRVQVEPPEIKVVRPAKGVSAWDVLRPVTPR